MWAEEVLAFGVKVDGRLPRFRCHNSSDLKTLSSGYVVLTAIEDNQSNLLVELKKHPLHPSSFILFALVALSPSVSLWFINVLGSSLQYIRVGCSRG